MIGRIRALPRTFWWAGASLVLMVVGAVGPWVKAEELTIHGTDGGRDGWVIVAAVTVTGIALLCFARYRRRWLAVIPLLAGITGITTTGYDISDINGQASENIFLSEISVTPGWGIYVVLAASVSLTLASVAFFVESRRREPAAVEAPTGA